MHDQFENSIQLKKRLSELKTQLEKIEERYIIGELKKDLYEKYETSTLRKWRILRKNWKN